MNQARAMFEQLVMPLFEVSQPEWLAQARATARRLCERDGSTTVNAVRAICPPPAGTDPRIMGSIFARGQFESIGYENSDRRACHGRMIARFKLRDRSQ